MIRHKFLTLLIFGTSLMSTLSAFEGSLQLRAAPFFPAGDKFREVYSDVAASYQIEAGIKYDNYDLWTNIDWVPKKDKRSCCHTKTDITQASFGLKYYFPLSEQTSFYIGIGPSFGKVVIHNYTCCFSEKHSKFGIGGVLKSGFQAALTDELFADAFLDYLYQTVKFHKRVQVGGLKLGLGLGLRF